MPNVNQKSQELTRVAECLYRNGNGIYVALIKVKGKQIKKSLKTKDRALANRLLGDLRKNITKLDPSEDGLLKFEEAADSWLKLIAVERKPNSVSRRKGAVKGLMPYFKGKQIRSIAYRDIEEWRRNRGATISPRSHNIELETLSLIFRYAINRGVIWENPVSKFQRRTEIKREILTLDRTQFAMLVKEMRQNPRTVESADLIEFQAYSALRIGESREIRWKDIDLERGLIRVTGGTAGTKNNRERTIRIYPNVRKLLDRILKRRGAGHPEERLFKIQNPLKGIKSACSRLGIPVVNTHSLRHFFCTNAIESGLAFAVIGKFLGHQDNGQLAAKTYGHLRADFEEASAAKLTFEAFPDEPDV